MGTEPGNPRAQSMKLCPVRNKLLLFERCLDPKQEMSSMFENPLLEQDESSAVQHNLEAR